MLENFNDKIKGRRFKYVLDKKMIIIQIFKNINNQVTYKVNLSISLPHLGKFFTSFILFYYSTFIPQVIILLYLLCHLSILTYFEIFPTNNIHRVCHSIIEKKLLKQSTKHFSYLTIQGRLMAHVYLNCIGEHWGSVSDDSNKDKYQRP